MKKGLTELVFVVDMSGSMFPLTADTIGGFNSTLNEQRRGEGELLVSTVLFNTETKVLHDRVPVAEVQPLTDKEYVAGGCTALLDALGGAIHHIGNVHKYAREEDVPEHTLFVITTDGMENASRRYSADKVRSMIAHEKEKYGWEFLFLASNIDAVETASHFGIAEDRCLDYIPDARGESLKYSAASNAIHAMRCNAPMAGWADEAQADFKKRSRRGK